MFIKYFKNIKDKIILNIHKYILVQNEKDNKFYTQYLNGDIYYYDEYGNPHNEDGPAIDTRYRKEYFLHGKRHRIDGPAVTFIHATEKRIIYTEYWLYGQRIFIVDNDNEFKRYVKLQVFH